MEHSQFIVKVLEEAREERGISIAELARRTNMSDDSLGNLLRGKRSLYGEELIVLAIELEVPIWKIIPPELWDLKRDKVKRVLEPRGQRYAPQGSGRSAR